MPESLGEKLRQAREERDITISEVAEQTRISPLYLEAIENDDYRTLPGGIFNKGFVKSFAKYVGLDEEEALQDYARLIASQKNTPEAEEGKSYRPEVLTDDRSGGSMLPTVIIAVVILGLMTWGVLALVNYLQTGESAAADTNANLNQNVSENANAEAANANTEKPAENLPSTDEIKVVLKAVGDEISVSANADGKSSSTLIKPDTTYELEAQESLRVRYAKSRAEFVNLTLNGKEIKLPQAPKVANSNIIDFEINKGNIKNILQTGAISFDAPAAAADSNTNTAAAP